MMPPFAIRVAALAHKETLHVLRDRQVIYLALGMPLVMVLLYGYAVSFDVTDMALAVVDHDQSAASRRLVRAFDASAAFRVTEQLNDGIELERSLRQGRCKGGLIIPADFSRKLARDQVAAMHVALDGADGTTARAGMGYAFAIARQQTAKLIEVQGAHATPLITRVRTLFNPAMRSALFVVPGLAAIVLGILAVLMSTITVAREWERGSMEQLFATPVDRLSVVLGKLLPYVAIGILQLLLVLWAGAWLFAVPLKGSLTLLMTASLLFLVCVLGQGLFISMVTRNQQVATQIGAISSVLPGLLLSGFVFPITNMPLPLRLLSYAVPTRYMVTVLRGILLQGQTVFDLLHALLGLAVLAVLIVSLSTVSFRRRLD